MRLEREKVEIAREESERNQRLISIKIKLMEEQTKRFQMEMQERREAAKRADRKEAFDRAMELCRSDDPELREMGKEQLRELRGQAIVE